MATEVLSGESEAPSEEREVALGGREAPSEETEEWTEMAKEAEDLEEEFLEAIEACIEELTEEMTEVRDRNLTESTDLPKKDSMIERMMTKKDHPITMRGVVIEEE